MYVLIMTNTNGTSSCYKSDNMYSVTQKQKLGKFCENYQVHLQYVFNQNRKLKILIRHIDFKELCFQQNFSTSSPNSTFFSCFTFTLMQGIIAKQIYSVAFEPERKLMCFPVHLALSRVVSQSILYHVYSANSKMKKSALSSTL